MQLNELNNLFASPLFGILLSVIAFEIGIGIYKKKHFPLFNPILIAGGIIIIFLITFNIPHESYQNGGKIISFFLGPATVVLAVPLYKKLSLLKEYFTPIMIGIFAGSLCSVAIVLFLGWIFRLDPKLLISLAPKSVTMPIGIEITNTFKGFEQITILSIVITGISGAIMAPGVLKIFKITDRVAKGIAIGTASHAVGTSKAIEIGETEGAMSGLAIGIAGLMTVFIIPAIVYILHILNVNII